MLDYFLFPSEGKPVKVSKAWANLVKIDMTGIGPGTPVVYFDKEQLIKDLKDLAIYLEKFGG